MWPYFLFFLLNFSVRKLHARMCNIDYTQHLQNASIGQGLFNDTYSVWGGHIAHTCLAHTRPSVQSSTLQKKKVFYNSFFL